MNTSFREAARGAHDLPLVGHSRDIYTGLIKSPVRTHTGLTRPWHHGGVPIEHPHSTVTLAPPPMNEFQWLLVLGFPAEIAAATVMPEVFIADEAASGETGRQLLAA